MGPSTNLINTWEISDGLWEEIELVLLAADPPKATGRKRVDQRRLLDAVVYKLRSGCQWNSLPRELSDDSTVHRAYQRWVRLGVFPRVWALVEESQGIEAASLNDNIFPQPAARPKTGNLKGENTRVGDRRGQNAS